MSQQPQPPYCSTSKPLALIVFLENVGHIHGLKLPRWVMESIDFLTEEYAKLLLHLYGAYRQYDQVVILEDERATGAQLSATLRQTSRTHRLDLLLLVHGHEGQLVGYKGKERVGAETFLPLLAAYRQDPSTLDLRMVYGLNCYGASLAQMWMALGATAVNGAVGVNWFPEPSLSVFLRNWLRGKPYSQAVQRSNRIANRLWGAVLRPDADGRPHPAVYSSRQTVTGIRDITIDS
jgi:hypothetical protein